MMTIMYLSCSAHIYTAGQAASRGGGLGAAHVEGRSERPDHGKGDAQLIDEALFEGIADLVAWINAAGVRCHGRIGRWLAIYWFCYFSNSAGTAQRASWLADRPEREKWARHPHRGLAA